MKVEVPKMKFTRLNKYTNMVHGFCGERGKRGGMVGKGRVP